METTLPEILDHLLEEIFLRLPSAEDLARTSAACVKFRGLVTDGSFLHRFHRLHAPPLLGFLDLEGFHPALPPHPSAPAAHALALAADADFTLSFLPSHCQWTVQDIRDGRFLLERKPEVGEKPPIFPELVVCDPLHQRYILLPPVPDDLVASVENTVRNFFGRFSEPGLIPPSEAETDETAFRVIWLARCGINLSIFVFSSSTGLWQAAASQASRDLFIGDRPLSFLNRHFACGCIYWVSAMNKKELLVLDTRTMEFSTVDFPPGAIVDAVHVAIVDAGEGRLGMFSIHYGNAGADSVLYYMVRENIGESSGQWDMNTISLGYGYRHSIKAATEKYLILSRMDA